MNYFFLFHLLVVVTSCLNNDTNKQDYKITPQIIIWNEFANSPIKMNLDSLYYVGLIDEESKVFYIQNRHNSSVIDTLCRFVKGNSSIELYKAKGKHVMINSFDIIDSSFVLDNEISIAISKSEFESVLQKRNNEQGLVSDTIVINTDEWSQSDLYAIFEGDRLIRIYKRPLYIDIEIEIAYIVGQK